MRMKSILLSLSAVVAMTTNLAHANLITNGSFEQTTNGTNKQLAASTPSASNRTTLVGWTSTNGSDGGYNFVLNPATATTSASALPLYGNNGFGASQDGGNFFASDPLYYPGYLYQTVNGLVVGDLYTLTFDYALAQQSGYKGTNTADWLVGFGTNGNFVTQTTAPLTIATGGFSGWQTATMTFTATSASEILAFLAQGSPNGAPPFMLLDGVSLESAVPEPSTLSLLLGGLGLAGFAARRRRKQS